MELQEYLTRPHKVGLRDVHDMTAAIAVKLIKELAACAARMQKTAT